MSCRNKVRAGLKMVASASLADVEPGFQPGGGGGVATVKRVVMPSHFRRPWFFPDGKMPSSTAGRDACRYIFRQTLRQPM